MKIALVAFLTLAVNTLLVISAILEDRDDKRRAREDALFLAEWFKELVAERNKPPKAQ